MQTATNIKKKMLEILPSPTILQLHVFHQPKMDTDYERS